jgi:hypothetical protein
MSAQRGLEQAGLHIGHDTRGVAEQPQLRAIGTVTAARHQHMGYEAITIGLKPAPEPLERGLIGRIAIRQCGAGRKE